MSGTKRPGATKFGTSQSVPRKEDWRFLTGAGRASSR